MNPDLRATLIQRLEAAWSLDTSSKWTPSNIAQGQCSVTALVVQDLFGGEILKTRTATGIHFYNRVGGLRYDFTASQFDYPIEFDDTASDRQEAMADTTPGQYSALSSRMKIAKRPSARLLVVDPRNRILLFRFRFDSGPLAGTAYWATPGGGLDADETYVQAARRELMEETGIDAEVGEAVAVRQTSFMLSTGEMVSAEEHYFLVRTNGAIDIGGNPDPVERAFIAEAKWWTGDEVAASEERVFPENIAQMVQDAVTREA